ncbi:MAG: hypothetical protein ACI4TH_03010 [Candidatus Ornithomonoglobus sp.]
MKIKNDIVMCFVCLFAGLVFVLASNYLSNYKLLQSFFLTLGITAIVSGIVNIFSSRLTVSNVQNIIEEKMQALKDCREYGLVAISENFSLTDEKIRESFMNSKKVCIIMSDAKNFISDNLDLFAQRIKKENKETIFIIHDYNESTLMNVLTKKNKHQGDYYINKIKEVIQYHLKEFAKKKNDSHILKVYLNSNFTTLAILLMDDYAIYSIYRVSSGKTKVPHYIFEKNTKEYNYVSNDVATLESTMKEVDLEAPV